VTLKTWSDGETLDGPALTDIATAVNANTAAIAGLSGGGATNLTVSRTATAVTVVSDTGTDATLAAADETSAGVMTSAMQTKLAGVDTGATANSADAVLLARDNHTGSQTASTISDFSAAADARVVAGIAGKLDISAAAELIRDTIGAALVAGTNVTITPDDAGDTITIAASTVVAPNTQTGTAYTLVLSDAGKAVEANNASANTVTVPPNSSVAFPVGTLIEICQLGAGQTTVVAGSGVTIRSAGGKLKLTGQYSAASLRKRASDEWLIVGDLSA
jgi:hypothetical protein